MNAEAVLSWTFECRTQELLPRNEEGPITTLLLRTSKPKTIAPPPTSRATRAWIWSSGSRENRPGHGRGPPALARPRQQLPVPRRTIPELCDFQATSKVQVLPGSSRVRSDRACQQRQPIQTRGPADSRHHWKRQCRDAFNVSVK